MICKLFTTNFKRKFKSKKTSDTVGGFFILKRKFHYQVLSMIFFVLDSVHCWQHFCPYEAIFLSVSTQAGIKNFGFFLLQRYLLYFSFETRHRHRHHLQLLLPFQKLSHWEICFRPKLSSGSKWGRKKIGPQIREKTETGGAATKSQMRKFWTKKTQNHELFPPKFDLIYPKYFFIFLLVLVASLKAPEMDTSTKYFH